MSPAKAKQRFTLPTTSAAMMDYLDHLGVNLRIDEDKKVGRVFERFNQLAAQGYDLSLANGTAEMEALKALNVFREFYTIDEYTSTTGTRNRAKTGEVYVTSQASIKGRAKQKDFYELDESENGFLDAMYMANAKVMRKFYGVADPVEVVGYHVDSFRENQNTSAPTRVTIVFSNGYATQAVHQNQVHASYMALKAGFDTDLRYRGTSKPIGMQPR